MFEVQIGMFILYIVLALVGGGVGGDVPHRLDGGGIQRLSGGVHTGDQRLQIRF